MSLLRNLASGLRSLFRKEQVNWELDEELRAYQEMAAGEKMKGGMSCREALRAVRLERGSVEVSKEIVRSGSWEFFVETCWQDLRFAGRVLRKSPGFTAMAVLTLALGIGANTAIFSVVNAVLVRPLPYPHPEQLVNVWRTQGQGWQGSVSIPDLRDWQQQNTTFEGISPFSTSRFALRGTSEPETAEGAYVSPNFFSIMQVPPIVGRGFGAGEDAPGQAQVVVLGYDLWIDQFGGQRSLVGQNILLNGAPHTVVGIMPSDFHYPSPLTSLWLPLVPTQEDLHRGAHHYLTVGRLKPGVSAAQGRTELNGISARLAQAYPDTDNKLAALLIPLKTAEVGRVHDSLLIVFGVVGSIFLLACANVSSFLLSRIASRRREIAMRAALGASRTRLVAQFFAESFVLTACGGLLAALTAHWSVAAVVALGKQYLPDPGRIKPDASVFAFTLGLAVLAAVLVSVGVAWHSAPGNMYNTLKESAQNVDGGRKRLRSRQVLVIGEFAAAFVLLIGAGTLLKSLANLARINPGFNPDHVLTMRIPLSPLKYTEQHPQSLFLQPMLETIGALPGVESAAIITYLPMQAVGTNSTFEIEGKPKPRKGEEPWAEMRAISPDYFRTMGIHLLRGRRFTDADSVDAPAVLVVNSAFVKDYFHDEDPIGRKIISTDESVASATIVGVVEDSLLGGLQDNPRPEADLPYPQARWSYLTRTVSLAVRTRQDPLTLAKQVQQAIYSLDSNQGVYGVKTMNDIVANTETDQRFVTWQLGIFSALALILAAAGLFGLISYSVSQRRHEIGVRMALGAQQSEVLRMIVGEGAKLTALGMALGLLASFGLTRLIGNLLYGVRAAEPVVMATSAFVLASIALLACYIPARRATRVDPLVALRYE